jgi:general L-amino acid transport system substrate-binding protein
MIKRLGVLLVVLALVAAACGDDSGDTDTTTATTTGGTDTTTATTTGGGGGDGDGDAGQGGSTLDAVKARGELVCGVSGSAPAFSETQPDGSMTGIDADYCRALAAAVLGDANAVTFVPLTAGERFDRLKAGDVDVLFRNTTWTASRDTDVGGDFGPTTYFDGQGLMGPSSLFTENSGPADVDGAVLCTNAGTTTEKNIREWAALGGAEIVLNTVEQFPDAVDLLVAGSCDLVTTDASGLVGNRVQRERNGEIAEGEWVVFPPTPISKEPLGPMYRQNDSAWADVIDWTVYATFIAYERGVNSANVDDIRASTDDPELQRLFGDGPVGNAADAGAAFGIPADGFYQVIKQVGSYDEIYDKNLNPVGLFREGSLNTLWTEGGLIYAPPFR